MSKDSKAPVLTHVLEEAFKKMAAASTTVVSSSYAVHRSNGELFVQRSPETNENLDPGLLRKAS